MKPDILLRVIGVSLSALGALMLAFRVKRILDALIAVAVCHEENQQQLARMANPNEPGPFVQFTNSTASVERAKKSGTILLVVGFLFIAVGNGLNAISLLLH